MRSISILVVVLACSPANATLIDLGNGTIYDTVQNLTWMQDARYQNLSGFQESRDAESWAANLTFAGFSDWRLPYRFVGSSAADSSEISRLVSQLGWTTTDQLFDYADRAGTGPFVNFFLGGNPYDRYWLVLPTGATSNRYWSATWVFDHGDPPAGGWAVRDGGNPFVGVPEPNTSALLLLGLLGTLFRRRRAIVTDPLVN